MFRLSVWIAGLCAGFAGALAAQTVIQSVSPATIHVAAGGGQSWVILRGQGLAAVTELRSALNGRPGTHLIGRPAPEQGGQREFVLMARPDAPLGPVRVVALTPAGAVPVPARFEIVAAGDPRAGKSVRPADISEAARNPAQRTILVDRTQVPAVMATVPSPLIVAPDGKSIPLRLLGRNLERVTEVRIRREAEPARYRGNQGMLPFRRVEGGLEVDVVASRSTAMGSRYAIDLMVEKFLATSVVLEVGVPPPPAPPPPSVETQPARGPTVIELPSPSPAPVPAP